MLKRWICVLFLPILVFSSQGSSPRELASMQPEPSALINGCVHAITGDFVFDQEDMIVRGAQEISIPRKYTSRLAQKEDSFENEILPHKMGLCTSSGTSPFEPYELYLTEPNGMQIFYMLKQTSIFVPVWGHYVDGISGYCKDTLGNSYHPKNNICHKIQNKAFCLVTSTGEQRYYGSIKELSLPDRGFQYFLRLYQVRLSNGIFLHYDYRKDHLYRIKAVCPSSGVTLSCIKFKQKENKLEMKGSDESWLTYEYKSYKNREKQSVQLLKQVFGSLYPTERLKRKKRLRISERQFPNQRTLHCKYNKQGRVVELHGPQGILANIEYEKGTTTSIDRDGNKTVYLYNSNTLRLNSIHYYQGLDKLLKTETFQWTPFGCLKEKTILSPSEEVLLTIHCKYNAHLDLIEKTINQEYTYNYEYDDHHHLIEEREDNGNRVTYTYFRDTTLPEEVCTYQSDQLLKRTRYRYNENHLLIEEITDGDGPYVFTKTIMRKGGKPFYGMPEIVSEYCTDNLIQKTKLTYDKWGNVTKSEIYGSDGRFAYSTETIYNEKGQVLEEVDPEGSRTTYTYDENGNLKNKTTPLGLKITYKYDNANRLIEKTETDGQQILTTSYREFDALDHPCQEIDPLQGITYRRYDALGNLISETNPKGHTTTYEYDPLGNTTSITNPLSRVTKTTYNQQGNPLTITHPDQSIENYTYNPDGTKASFTDTVGVTTRYTYDIYGNLASEESEVLRTWTYDAFHLLEETNLDGYKTKYQYDPLGRKSQETYEGRTTHLQYDPLSRLAAEQNGDIQTKWTYDKLGHITSEKAYDQDILITRSETTYNAEGNPLVVTNYPNTQPAKTTYTYDAFNREISRQTPLGHQTTTSYQVQPGKKTLTISEPGNLTEIQTYNELDQLISLERKDPENKPISYIEYIYCPDGQLQKEQTTIFEKGCHKKTHTIEYTFDLRGRKETETESGLKTTRYSYYADGKLKTIHKPDGVIISHTYNSLGHLISLKSSKGDIDYSFTYTNLGDLVLAKDLIRQTQTEKIVDPHGNILKETLANGLHLKNQYDENGRRIQLDLPSGKTVHYSYLGPHLTSVSIQDLTHTYTYDLAGNLLQESHLDKTNTEYLYDLDNRLIHRKSPHLEEAFEYDTRDNTIQILENGTEKTYTYDSQDHLIEEPNHTYGYDSIHNRIQKNHTTTTFNPLNQENHLEYDPNGNLLTRGNNHFEYDSLDRLVKVITPHGEFLYTYDSEHRRIFEDQTPILWDGQHELGPLGYYRILGLTPIAEIGAAIAIAIDQRILQPLHTARGDLIQLLHPEFTKLSKQNFTSFGEGGVTTRWGYRSKVHDVTGLIYFGRRYYDPTLGRFITSDPEGYTDSANLYTYALNNPLTHHDPYGLFAYPSSLQLYPQYNQRPEFDPNRWKEVGAALGHAGLAYTRDTAFGLAKGEGGYHGPEDMSFMEIYDATNQARNQLFQASENWMQSSPYAGTELYDFVRSSAYMGIDFAAAYLLPGMKLKAGVSAGVSAGKAIYRAEKTAFASPTLLKTNQVFGKIFKSSKTSSHYRSVGSPIWTSTKEKTSVQNAYQHWKDHRCDFLGTKNSKQYVEATQNFTRNPPLGTLTKTRANGDVIFYHPASNTFAITNKFGVPRTMYKPNTSIHKHPTNLEYFYGQ